MTDLEIKFPVEGRDDSQTPGRQQQTTTSDSSNVRGEDPVTGRNGGAVRAGTRKACEAQLGSEAVRDLAQCLFDARRIEYGVLADPVLLSATTGQSNGDAWDVKCDLGGNVYIADGGKSIEVRNTDNVVIGSIALPCDDPDSICRALCVDSGNRVFSGVSEGGDQALARMWCYERDAYGGYRQLWVIDAGGFVEVIVIAGGRLHALVNDPATGRKFVKVWRDPDAAVPTLEWQHSDAAPGFSMAIAPNGDIAVGSTSEALRATDPRAPQSTQILDEELADFHIAQLPDIRLRKWCWLRARDLVLPTSEDNDDVTAMLDRFGLGRNLYCPVGVSRTVGGTGVTVTAPKLKLTGTLGARPGVRFNGANNLFLSYPNASKSASADDTQKTLLPAYTGGGFALFLVVRMDRDETVTRSCVFAQDCGTNNRRMVANKDNTGGVAGSFHITEKSGANIGGYASFDNSNSGGILSLIVDSAGNVDMYWNGTRMSADGGLIPYAAGTFASLKVTEIGQSSIGGTPDPGWFAGEIYEWLCLRDYTSSTTGLRTVCLDADRQIIEGTFAWDSGIQALLPAGHPYRLVPPPSPRETVARYTNAQKLLSPTPIITKFKALTHKIAWVLASDVTTSSSIGGLGYGLAFNSAGDLYSVGPPIAPTGPGTDESRASIRKIVDKGDTYSLDPADGAWHVPLGTTAGETFSYDKLRLAVDEFDNVFIPFYADGYAMAAPSFLAYDKTGNQILVPLSVPPQGAHAIAISPLLPDFEGNPTPVTRPEIVYLARRRVRPVVLSLISGNPAAGDYVRFTPSAGSVEQYTFAAVLVTNLDVLIGATPYESRENFINAVMGGPGNGTGYLNTSLTGSALFDAANTINLLQVKLGLRVPAAITALVEVTGAISIFGPNATIEATATLEKFDLLTKTQVSTSGRERVLLGVSGTDIVTFDLGASAVVPTGGAAALDANARYVQSAYLGGRTFFTDGIGYKVFEGRTGVVSAYTSNGYGAIPQRCTGIEAWRAGIFLFGDPDDASNYFLSEQGNPFGWDFYPDVVSEVTATWGAVGAAGKPDDIITGFCPYVDGYGLLFCDHSLWSITGNPSPGSNGRVEQVSKITGGAPGRAWCIGPQGEVYFWGAQGGVWVFAGGVVKALSVHDIQRELQEIDLSKFYVRMSWNWRYDGLDIMFCPYGGVTDTARCYVWERGNGAFWPDDRSNPDHQPCSLLVLDGDQPQDRRTIFGCRDGYVRTWDELKDDDDGSPINSSILIGPLNAETTRFNTMVSRLQIITESAQGACRIEFYTSDTPSDKGRLRRVYTVRPGLNNFSARFQAPYVWLRITSQERWAFEAAVLAVEPGSFKQPSRRR